MIEEPSEMQLLDASHIDQAAVIMPQLKEIADLPTMHSMDSLSDMTSIAQTTQTIDVHDIPAMRIQNSIS